MNTNLLQRNLSKAFPNRILATTAEVLFLLMLGAIAVAIHSKWKIPMHLPGKQGVIFVALLVTGRGISRFTFAASITCLGAALFSLSPMLGVQNPLMSLTYLFLGGTMDFCYRLASNYSDRPWVLALASGVAWMFIPLFRLFLSLFATMPLNMFSSGPIYPFLTHLLFGFTGGLLGAGILTLLNWKK